MRKLKKKGFILVDVLIGSFIVVIAALSLLSLTTVTKKSQTIAKDRSIANKISNRVIEHLQLLKPTDLTADTLSHLNLIDSGQTAGPYTFSNIPLDDASRYSPATTLPSGTGTMTFTSLESNSVLVKIVVSWRAQNGTTQSVQTGTIVGGYR